MSADLSGVNVVPVVDSAPAVPAVPVVPVVPVVPAVPAALSLVNVQFLQVMTELLQNKPQNTADALALYHSVTVQLSAYLVSNLPSLEQKAAAMAMWAVQELESGKCVSWLCRK